MGTFKEYLIEKANEEKSKVKGGFNPANLNQKAKQTLNMMMKASGKESGIYSKLGDLDLLEAISILKEVLVSRLLPFKEDPDYAEKRGDKDHTELMENITNEIKEVFSKHFPEAKGAMNSFMNLIGSPILAEVKRVGPAAAIKAFSTEKFDMSSKDIFGYMMRHMINSDIIRNQEDAEVAEKTMMKWNKDVIAKRKNLKKPLSKSQRMAAIKRAAEINKELE